MNREEMLIQALASILMQGCFEVEIILKDGNPDKPVLLDERVKHFLDRWFPSYTHLVGRDKGIFDALNICLERSTGDILYFMCSDDLLCAGALQAVVDAFNSDTFGGAMWLYGKTISADITGKTLGIDGDVPNYALLKQHNCIGQPSVFWTRAMYRMAGPFDSRYIHAADYDMWLRFWQVREPIYLDQTLGIFRHHQEQFTSIFSQDVEAEAQRIAMRHATLGQSVLAARTVWSIRRAYKGETPPLSHDD